MEGVGKDGRVLTIPPGLTFALSWPSASWAHPSLLGQEGADQPGQRECNTRPASELHGTGLGGSAVCPGVAGWPPYPLRSLPLSELPLPSPRGLEMTQLGGQCYP